MEVSAFSIIVAAPILVYIAYRLFYWRFFRLASQWPGPKSYPIVGNAIDLLGPSDRIFDTLVTHLADFEDLGRLWIGPRFLAFLFHPDDVEMVLNSNDFLDKSVEYDFLRPWIGNGLLTSTGNVWRAHRRAIAPTFYASVLKDYMRKFNENAQGLVSELDRHTGAPLDIHDHMSVTITRTLLETAMGVDIEPKEKHLLHGYVSSVKELSNIIHYRHTKAWLRSDLVFSFSKYASSHKSLLNSIHKYTMDVLLKKKAEVQINNGCSNMKQIANRKIPNGEKDDIKASNGREPNKTEISGTEQRKLPFLESLIQKALVGDTFTLKDVHEQIDTFMFEGHDTASAATSMLLCSLASKPEIQEKCYDELQWVLGGTYRELTLEDLNEMKYLDRCLLEAMRLYPPVPVMARKVHKDVKLVSRDLTIPSGSTVIVTTYALQRRADVFPNPDEFDPDHFLPERIADRHHYAYIPFSAGPRVCVGKKFAMLEMKTILATVLWNFKITQIVAEEEWTFSADLILKRRDGYKIGLVRRQK
uniref:Cytochrome P450 4g15 n=1 Tax=Lygus hesperus TaxID=30085 RepID=A0A0A9YT33_LYGHE